MPKYFGTDGIRGIAGEGSVLCPKLSYKVGFALASFFGTGKYVLGRDTRVSGPEIEAALVRGIKDGGGTALLLGIIPTPAVGYHTIGQKAKCGIMVSASHNPPEYNGIKVFGPDGKKLNEEQEGSVEYYIDNPSAVVGGGSEKEYKSARKEYLDYLCQSVEADLSGLKIHLDCGYGAAATVAKEAFERLGAVVKIENYSLRGEKINSGCGALHPNYVAASMKDTDSKLGFAFDGDADRVSVVYDGVEIDGDTVLYNISKAHKLKDGVVVGTILSNYALESTLANEGKRLIRTPVGDKYICDLMYRHGYNLGGEQSGHYIIFPEATTGDGILAAMFFAGSLYKGGKLKAPYKLKLLPQKMISLTASPAIMYDAGLNDLIKKYNEVLKGKGRLIVRMSGTEPKIRVMAESEDAGLVDAALAEFKEYIGKFRG